MHKTCLEIICCKKNREKPLKVAFISLMGCKNYQFIDQQRLVILKKKEQKKRSQSSCDSVGSIFSCVGYEEMHLTRDREAAP